MLTLNTGGFVDVTSFKQEILTAADDLDVGYSKGEHIETDADLNPMFVQIQTLTRGHVFVCISHPIQSMHDLSVFTSAIF